MRCRRECTRSIGSECEISGLIWLGDEETLREDFSPPSPLEWENALYGSKADRGCDGAAAALCLIRNQVYPRYQLETTKNFESSTLLVLHRVNRVGTARRWSSSPSR